MCGYLSEEEDRVFNLLDRRLDHKDEHGRSVSEQHGDETALLGGLVSKFLNLDF